MEIRVNIFGLVMMSLCVFVPDAQGTINADVNTLSVCYNNNLSPACDSGYQIAITSYFDGFKAASLQCPLDGSATGPCCTYNNSGDCLQDAPTESRYVDVISGRDSGVISTSSVSPSSNGSCESSSLSASSVFSELNFLCISGNATGSMCSNVSLDMTTGDAVYLKNRNYPDGISSDDSLCNCSVELDEFEPMHLYIIHLALYDNPENCQQNLTLYDGQGDELKTFNCNDHPYNTIMEEILNTTYIKLEMNNRFTVTNGGKFWFGFQGENGSVALRCPAVEQLYFAGCSNLTNPEDGTVNVTSLSYMGIATYTCNSGFTAVGGDPQRTCLKNNTWSGEPLVCQAVKKNESRIIQVENKTTTACFGKNLSPVCDHDYEIAIISYHDGFKNPSCPIDGTATGDCCKYDKNTDCLQKAPTESRYVDAFSGKDSGSISTSSVSSTGSCSSSLYSASSVFSEIKYLCIPESSTISMCSSNVTTGDAVFIQNRDYPASSILNTDTHCNCSIEVVEFEPIHLYIIHLDLFDTPGNCQQNLTLYDGQGRVLRTFKCEDHPYNTIVNETLSTTYIRLEMNNRYNVTNGGKFWIGFRGTGTISLRCPAEEQVNFSGCSNLTNPEDGTVMLPVYHTWP